jgi:hypothetical protein
MRLCSCPAALFLVGPTPQPKGVPISPEEAGEFQPETWAIHGQSTLVTQFHPGFFGSVQPPEQSQINRAK